IEGDVLRRDAGKEHRLAKDLELHVAVDGASARGKTEHAPQWDDHRNENRRTRDKACRGMHVRHSHEREKKLAERFSRPASRTRPDGRGATSRVSPEARRAATADA